MSEERLKILKMVEEGKISPEKAVELLKEIEDSTVKVKNKKKRYLRIYVESEEDNETVNLKVPLSLLKVTKYIKYLVPKRVTEKNEKVKQSMDMLNELNWNEILNEIESGEELVNIESEDGVIKIWVE